MRTFVYSIPGNVGYEYIQADSKESAQQIADKTCESHSFLGGKVQPLVKEVRTK